MPPPVSNGDFVRPAKTALPDKQFFKIGEAAELIGVKTHVLRYWESEFPSLRPMKTRGAHRMYRRVDVELGCVIRRLLHEEGYTIPGAKKRVRELSAERTQALAQAKSQPQPRASSAKPKAEGGVSRELRLRAELIQVRNELSALLASFDMVAAVTPVEGPKLRATVTAVVAKTALIHSRTR